MECKRIALAGAAVLDGCGNKIDVGTVLVEDGKILDVMQGFVCPEGFELLDLRGKYLMPGMIEMHGHLYANIRGTGVEDVSEQYPLLALAGGVTTFRSAGERYLDSAFRVRDEIKAGKRDGARILTAGAYLNKKGPREWWMPEWDTLEEVLSLYHSQKDRIDQVKVYNQMPAQWIGKVCELAHNDGLKVYGHLGQCSVKDAALAGIDGVEHGLYNTPEFYTIEASTPETFGRVVNFDVNAPEVDAQIETVVGRDLAFTLTNVIIATDGPKVTERMERCNVYRFYSPEVAEYHRNRRAESDVNLKKIALQDGFMEKAYRYAEKLHRAGGRLFAGTDPVYLGLIPGYALCWEAEELQNCGMTNSEILQALTLKAAEELGIGNITGSVTKGKLAELAILEKDPLADIRNLESVCTVLKDGKIYDSEALRVSLEGSIQ